MSANVIWRFFIHWSSNLQNIGRNWCSEGPESLFWIYFLILLHWLLTGVFTSRERVSVCLPGRLSHPARRPFRSLLGQRKEVAASSRKKAAQDLGHMETQRRGTFPCPWKQLLWTAHPASSNSSSSPSFLEARMPQARPTSASSGWRVSWMDNLQWNAFPF